MSHQVVIKPAAQRQFKKLTLAIQKDLIALIEGLSEDPRPSGCKKLKGWENQYRVRSGDYSIVYGVEDALLMIRVIKVGHRLDVYEE
ncbi:type II toxin-antitoxin system RelE family toxin [Leptolyngbya sp. 7M]|uniref:type II toxin-antitoxin system RelE family toxin n=1 Tax=Leptolyngbya sp. 7M TaxID=2812896 RepID=UPI001B8ACAED|nr:type II toxin-antitoxin system RelE/ParE family toxin [Leptolyngbya sp. 7M]QYO62099.1 type II toxin-antitoxin system RelE/ParE family toxin [Leptolyngbya sp. 7M]